MNKSDIRKKCENFIYSTGMKRVDFGSLSDALEKCGYTVILFRRGENDPDVQEMIDTLKLSAQVKNGRGFTVACADYKLIFVSEELDEPDRLKVLAHETGHINLGHMKNTYVLGADVQEEFDANTFAAMLLDQPWWMRPEMLLRKHCWEAGIAALVIAVLIVTVFTVSGLQKKRISDAQEQFGKVAENITADGADGVKSMSDVNTKQNGSDEEINIENTQTDSASENDIETATEETTTEEKTTEEKTTEEKTTEEKTTEDITTEENTAEETAEETAKISTEEETEIETVEVPQTAEQITVAPTTAPPVPETTAAPITTAATTAVPQNTPVVIVVTEPVTTTSPESQYLAMGTSGGATYTLDKNGVLTFTGKGSMACAQTQIGVYHNDNYYGDSFASYRKYFSGEVLVNTVVSAPNWRDTFDPALVTSVVVNEGITDIPDGTFAGMNNLKAVSLPSTLTSIGKSAFEGCISLTAIDIPAGVTTIQENTFRGSFNLCKITLHDGVKSIESGAFSYLYWTREAKPGNPVTFTMPDTVTTVAGGAFEGNGRFTMYVSDNLQSAEQSNYLFDFGNSDEKYLADGVGLSFCIYYVKENSTAEEIIKKWCVSSEYYWVDNFRYKNKTYSDSVYEIDYEDKYYDIPSEFIQ